jgi:hypothetical protein
VPVSKQQRHEQEVEIFSFRHEQGLHVMRDWLLREQVDINRVWPGTCGDDLVRMQGEARVINRLIELIEHGPKVKI